MLFELHAHTIRYSSCSHMSPEEYIKAAKEKGLTGICLTEHSMFWPEEEYRALCENVDGLVIINGNEQRCWDGDIIQGDFLVFGCRFRFEKPTAIELIDFVHKAGGVVIAAHPFRELLGVSEDLIYQLDIDAIEVYSSNQEPWQTVLACSIAKKKGIPVISGSDAHVPELVGYSVTRFTVPIKGEKDFVDAIKDRRFVCVPHEKQIETNGR